MALIPHPHYTLEDEGDNSTLPPPLVLKSKFRIKRPCWEPWLPSIPVCFLFGVVGKSEVYLTGRHLGEIIAAVMDKCPMAP